MYLSHWADSDGKDVGICMCCIINYSCQKKKNNTLCLFASVFVMSSTSKSIAKLCATFFWDFLVKYIFKLPLEISTLVIQPVLL